MRNDHRVRLFFNDGLPEQEISLWERSELLPTPFIVVMYVLDYAKLAIIGQ